MKISSYVVTAYLIASFGSVAFADDICEGGEAAKDKADAQLKQAEDLEKAGRARDAYNAAAKVDQDCVSKYAGPSDVRKRTAKIIAAEEEKKARFKEAFQWYEIAQSPADAGRMQRKLVESKPDDINTVAAAIGFFARMPDAVQEKDMRAHALKNVDKALATEEKRFALIDRDSLGELGRAKHWAYYAGTGESRAKERAEKRGDTLLAEEPRRLLELALKYYAFAEKRDKEQKVRDKARALAERAVSKGEAELAAAYYEVAGDSAKAIAIQKQHEQKAQQTEEVRKKSFEKEQDQLEKELGLEK